MANIITGIRIVISVVLLFVFPLTLAFTDVRYSAVIVCMVATIAAVHEGYLVIRKRNIG